MGGSRPVSQSRGVLAYWDRRYLYVIAIVIFIIVYINDVERPEEATKPKQPSTVQTPAKKPLAVPSSAAAGGSKSTSKPAQSSGTSPQFGVNGELLSTSPVLANPDGSRKKVAICLSGGFRMFTDLEEQWIKHAIEPNGADVFAHIYTSTAEEDAAADTIRQRPYLKHMVVEKFDKITSELEPFMREPRQQTYLHEQRIGVRTVSMWRKIFKCNQMLHEYERQHGVRYDIVVRARPDLMHPLEVIYAKCPPHKMCIPGSPYYPPCPQCSAHYEKSSRTKCRLGPADCPETKCQECAAVNDKYAWGSPDAMDVYADIYFHLHNITQPINPIHPEHRVYQSLLQRGLLDMVQMTKDLDPLKRPQTDAKGDLRPV
eukprot:TRINITY_DN6056_c0_g1_i3.p1 TRINITY_DN6056_c0_g1~~TRINITY_DN6056_c0_g1_i3.p1  ORF type:complete len:372 (-),score=99.03 TRINITY_DN6056_c0_g1_i3:6-1121(-)